MTDAISFIVSAYNRAPELAACLASLALNPPGKLVVVCNATDPRQLEAHRHIANQFSAVFIETAIHGATCCYSASEIAANLGGIAETEWLCFPSDDSLYVQDFAKIMLATAVKHNADLVYCDCVYRVGSEQNDWPAYTILDVSPRMGRIDKTCFIVRRNKFKGFPPHARGWRDGALIEQLIAEGIRHAKAPGVLVVHQ